MSQIIMGAATIDSWLNRSSNRWLLTDNDSGYPILSATSFLSLDIRCDGQVVSAPIEDGAFASYNKSVTPLIATVTLGFQGDDAALQDVLDILHILQRGTRLLSLVTPNAEYANLNLESYNYTRKRENGLGALCVEIILAEVWQVEAQYTNANLAPCKDRGKVQPEETSALAGILSWIRGH